MTAQDTIASKQLDELVVTGERCWIVGNTINYIPTKDEKKLSDSPASLVQSMHLPMLRIKNESIENNGDNVAVFINGQRATETDLATFWPSDVKKIQYIENPNDPLFEGERFVVNFVTARYVVGGVSKIKLYERIPTSGIYKLASKVAYKKMEFGILASYINKRDHRTRNAIESEYRDIYYNGNFYDIIKRNQEEIIVEKSNYVQSSFNAKYYSSKFIANHTVSIIYDHNPFSKNDGSDNWTDNLFDSSYSWNSEKSRRLSPQISGNYIYVFNPKWYLTCNWTYAYSSNSSRIWNKICDTDIIFNYYKENVNSCNLSVNPTFICSPKISLQMKISTSLNWFNSYYQGSAQTRNDISTHNLNSTIKIYWIPSNKIYVTMEPGVIGNFKHIGEASNNSLIPTLNASFSYTPNSKLNMGINAMHYSMTASASESNPVLVRASELLWVKGNPHLKNKRFWDVAISVVHMPKKWVSISYWLGYFHSVNDVIATYVAGESKVGGIIKQMTNAKPMTTLNGNVSLQFSLFNERLSIGVSPNWSYYHCKTGFFKSFNWVSFSADIDYTIKNIRIAAEYEGPHKDIDCNGMQKSWRQDCMNASITYGTGNILLQGRILNIFNRRSRDEREFVSPCFLTKSSSLKIGREFSLSFTYTFGYGKKIDRQIDIDNPITTESSIIKIR